MYMEEDEYEIPFHESYADEETMGNLEGDAYEEYMKAYADHHGTEYMGGSDL